MGNLSDDSEEILMNSVDSDSDNDDVVIKSVELLFIFETKNGKLKIARGLVDSSCSKNLCEESLVELLKGAIVETNKSTN